MLTTLLRPTTGSLELDGLDVTARPMEVRKRFGVVFQDPSLDGDLTAWENMDIHGVLYHVPRHARRERCEALLRMFELWERRDDLVKTFSGGMKRRLEIARGLLHTPKVLFLDEPTLGLDPQSRNQKWTHVRNLRASEGVTGARPELARDPELRLPVRAPEASPWVPACSAEPCCSPLCSRGSPCCGTASLGS